MKAESKFATETAPPITHLTHVSRVTELVDPANKFFFLRLLIGSVQLQTNTSAMMRSTAIYTKRGKSKRR